MIDEFELIDHQADGYMALIVNGEIASIVECGIKRYKMVVSYSEDVVEVEMRTVEYSDLEPYLSDVDEDIAEYEVKMIHINGKEIDWSEIEDPFIFDQISNLSNAAWYSTDPRDYAVFLEAIIGMPQHGLSRVVLASEVGDKYSLYEYCIRKVYKNES